MPELSSFRPPTELAGVSGQTDFGRAGGMPFALVPMTGLRSLTLELSWKAWSLPEQVEIDSDLDDSLCWQGERIYALARSAPLPISPLSSQPDFESCIADEDDHDDVLEPRTWSTQSPGNRVEVAASARVERTRESEEGGESAQLSGDRAQEAQQALATDEFGLIYLPPATACSEGTDELARPIIGPTSPGPSPTVEVAQGTIPFAVDSVSRSETGVSRTLRGHARRFDTSHALDRFLSLRGKHDLARGTPAAGPQARSGNPRDQHVKHATPAELDVDTASGPPSIPSLPPPAFLLDPTVPTSRAEPCRIVAFDPIFQRRDHLRAMEDKSLQLVHRSSRPIVHSPPDLIIDPVTCVTISRLIDLLRVRGTRDGSAFTSAPHETIPDRIEGFAQDYEHVVVILEEQHQRVAGRRVSSYSKPVLSALDRLGATVVDLRSRAVSIDVAFSRSPEHTAEIVARLVSHKRWSEQPDACGFDLWSERLWLTTDPTKVNSRC